jgi:uncharacterized protein YndB with AHSA1/START domain
MASSKSRDSEEEAARTVIITREFDLPAHLLFLAYSAPEHVMKWFGPPGYPLTLCEMAFREGGKFRFAMTGPDGKQHTPFGGTYLEIVENEKITYDNAFEMEGAEKMVVSVSFEEKNSRTTITDRPAAQRVAPPAHRAAAPRWAQRPRRSAAESPPKRLPSRGSGRRGRRGWTW